MIQFNATEYWLPEVIPPVTFTPQRLAPGVWPALPVQCKTEPWVRWCAGRSAQFVSGRDNVSNLVTHHHLPPAGSGRSLSSRQTTAARFE